MTELWQYDWQILACELSATYFSHIKETWNFSILQYSLQLCDSYLPQDNDS